MHSHTTWEFKIRSNKQGFSHIYCAVKEDKLDHLDAYHIVRPWVVVVQNISEKQPSEKTW